MQKLLSSIFLILIYSSAFSQINNTIHFADSLIKQGTFKAAIVNYEYPAEIKALQAKALKNLKNDPKWAGKYIIHLVEVGDKGLRYEDGMGLSTQEFDKLLTAFKKDKDVILSDTFNLKIIKTNGVITFNTTKKATLFNKLKIDTRKAEITYENLKLTKEVKSEGGKLFAPKLQGYEAHGSRMFSEDKPDYSMGSFGLCIGVNTGETRTTICLMMFPKSTDKPEFLTIAIL